MKEEYIDEFRMKEWEDLFEAFNAFIMVNPGYPLLARDSNLVARPHYVKQDLGLDFIYNCNFYGIKMVKVNKDFINNPYLDCTITKFQNYNGSKIVESSVSFRYDCVNSNIIEDIKLDVNPDKIIKMHLKQKVLNS